MGHWFDPGLGRILSQGQGLMKVIATELTIYLTLDSMHQLQTAFENIVEKEEIALFPMFSTQSENGIPICQYL